MSIELFKLVFLLLTLKPNIMKEKFRYKAFAFMLYAIFCVIFTTVKIVISIFNTFLN